jgi:hypothetical protein
MMLLQHMLLVFLRCPAGELQPRLPKECTVGAGQGFVGGLLHSRGSNARLVQSRVLNCTAGAEQPTASDDCAGKCCGNAAYSAGALAAPFSSCCAAP